MPQWRSKALPRHQKKDRWGTNKEIRTATFETINARTKTKQKKKKKKKKKKKSGFVYTDITVYTDTTCL